MKGSDAVPVAAEKDITMWCSTHTTNRKTADDDIRAQQMTGEAMRMVRSTCDWVMRSMSDKVMKSMSDKVMKSMCDQVTIRQGMPIMHARWDACMTEKNNLIQNSVPL